jgi:hypothetical protein
MRGERTTSCVKLRVARRVRDDPVRPLRCEPWGPGGLFVFPVDVCFAFGVDLDVQRHRVAADRAILDVVLAGPGREVDGDDDLLAAGIADVGALGVDAGSGTTATA